MQGKHNAISKSSLFKGYFDPIKLLSYDEKSEAIVLESADVVTKLGEKSIALLDLALSIEARNNEITLSLLMEEARPLLLHVAQLFSEQLREQHQDRLIIRMESLSLESDLLKKLRAPSALDILRAIKKAIVLEDHKNDEALMLSGVFAYDFLDHFENLPEAKKDELTLPDFLFYVPLTVVVMDHPKLETCITAHALISEQKDEEERAFKRLKRVKSYIESVMSDQKKELTPPAVYPLDKKSYAIDVPDQEFGHLIERCQEHIKAGDVYQIVPSRTFSRPIKDPMRSYEALRRMNPSPYMFYLRTKEWTLFGASPETFIKVDQKGTCVSVRPIAGTRRRGLNAHGQIDVELDSREQASLCLDEKELAEHMMLVDLARNDIASVAKEQSRRIKRLLGVDRFSHVMHLVSEVEGTLKDGFDALSAYQASMNMGTLMGAPKVRAAELLRQLERTKRGFYGGAVGYINAVGDMDTAIIIRSAVVKDGKAYVRAGCGVVYDSNVAFEVQETINKAEAVLKAMELA
ncbi:MAG TPA: anthranilate synthase component 1, partial [Myxococcota bacterium]|nr:anthranilate synthase component 1 [Myxococcota bacterium]